MFGRRVTFPIHTTCYVYSQTNLKDKPDSEEMVTLEFA